MTAHKQWQK